MVHTPVYYGPVYLSWSKADQEEKEESKERDPMNRCQDAESKEGGRTDERGAIQ